MNELNSFDKAVDFLTTIGIVVKFEPIDSATFLPGVSIENGQIIVDREKMKYPGDILHEAGHIAVVPAKDRSTLNEQTIIQREQRDAEEMMVIAWSYAACVHLGIDAGFVFHDDDLELFASIQAFFLLIIGTNCAINTPNRIRKQPMSARPVRV